MNAEYRRKLAQVRSLLKSAKADAALIGRQSNFSWLTCGGEAHVPLNSDRAFGQLVVTRDAVYLFANVIELPRLLDEELRGLGVKPLRYEWHDANPVKTLRQIADPKRIISDTGEWGTRARPELFAPLRYSLQPAEVKRLRALGQAAEAVMNETCHRIKPGQDELQLAGQLASGCWQRHLTPVVLLIAVDERIERYRHPIPTQKKLKRCAMLVLCARQHGLIVSLTRLVHFGELSEDMRWRHSMVCAVDGAFILNTRVGTPVRNVFWCGIAAYSEYGYPDEWRLHHQGGPCGYEPRDYLGSPTAPGVVLENQAFAWNPTIAGTKSEDTILATTQGAQIITESKDWPMLQVESQGETILRPDILVR
ncbi:MAG: M24 family metallopeptidase [Verrucomicrobia bacterium]|nr:M24 family metallopeptidase [Verrucomicrobiota bacterium]